MSLLALLLLTPFTCILTWLIRRYALASALLDLPNHRSSHTIPTPKGGGLAFVACFMLLVMVLLYGKQISLSYGLALLLMGGVVAALGFWDDRRSVSPRLRLFWQFLSASISLALLGNLPALDILGFNLPTGLLWLFCIFYLVWLLNLYNFMDGINGLAALEAITVGLASSLLYAYHHHEASLLLPFGLACSVLGFLFWNFPTARIFMGDVGSSFLGFVMGLLSLQAAYLDPAYFWSWLILLGVFIVDATVTLGVRAFGEEPLFQAHCSHAYQQAARFYRSHGRVSLFVAVINLLWLLPWALLVSNHSINGCVGLLLAYVPLVMLAIKYRAGLLEKLSQPG